jgi:ligand-binding sensor domain-containing protein/serine phosphatase RsbU (regulator of sigma subunit)
MVKASFMRKTLLTGLLVMVLYTAYPQYIPFDNYTVTEESERKRLPANVIMDIEQDKAGYLWLATQVGAIQFDGYGFRSISITEGLPDNNVYDIFIDSRNRVWIASESGGLACLENNKLNLINTQNGLVSDNALKVLEDRSGNIWYFSMDGISVIRPDTIISYSESNSEVAGKIFASFVASDGKIWFSTISFLFFYDGQLHKIESPLFIGHTIMDIKEDRPGSIWFASQERGIIHITQEDTTVFNKNNGLKSNTSLVIQPLGIDTVIASTGSPGGLYFITKNRITRTIVEGLDNYWINQILIDSQKKIWVSSMQNGLLLIEKNKIKTFDVNNNLVHNNLLKLFEDSNGNVWIATSNGLSKYGKVIFHIYKDGFIDDDIYIQSIAERNNTIFFGTYSGLNVFQDEKTLTWLDQQEGTPPSPNPDVFSILPDRNSSIWLANFNGITRIDGRQSKFISYRDAFPSEENEFTTDLLSLDNRIYCATSMGLIVYDGSRFSRYTVEDGLSDNNIWSLALDQNKNIWCATINGLSIFDGNTFHNFGTESGLPHNYCNDIAFDAAGDAWVATDNGISIVRLNPGWNISCRNVDSKNGLKSNTVFSVLIDKKGLVWIGHNSGLDRMNPATEEIVHYGPLEGFIPVETSLGAATATSGNNLWFGTVNGAVKYIPENDLMRKDPPKIYFKKIALYNDSTRLDKFSDGLDSISQLPVNLVLPYNKNNLVFYYVGLHYTIIEKNSYKYYLEGYDNDWSEVTHDIVTPPYRKIPPGIYTFKVLAANCDGVWAEKPAEYSFEIKPPFWQTWWAYTLEILTGILALYLFIRLRERKLRQDKIILTRKVKERTIEIEKQRDQIAIQKQEIEDSILYAERIQTAVLPKDEFISNFLPEYFVLYKPKNIVSGDFYWINGKDQRVIVVAADCTGHGVPGALMSMLGVSILNELASSPEPVGPNAMLDILRTHLTKTLRQTGRDEDAKDGMDMAMCIIDFKNMSLQFSGAYNPLVHIREGECEVYKGDKMPVGFHMGEMTSFSCQEIKLKKGDCLYMFSDGYADQFGGPEGKKYKSAALRDLLISIYYLPMKEQKMKLNETIEDWKGINEQVDDILVMGIRI